MEREEEEQPLRHGKGLARRADDEDSPFDEDEVDNSSDKCWYLLTCHLF